MLDIREHEQASAPVEQFIGDHDAEQCDRGKPSLLQRRVRTLLQTTGEKRCQRREDRKDNRRWHCRRYNFSQRKDREEDRFDQAVDRSDDESEEEKHRNQPPAAGGGRASDDHSTARLKRTYSPTIIAVILPSRGHARALPS